MKPEITLVYDADCPNLPAARGALRKALEHEGLEPQWVEYDRAAPARLRYFSVSGRRRFLSRASIWAARRDMPPPPRPVGSIGASADFPASRRPRVSPWQSRIARRLRTRRGYQSRQPLARSCWPERRQSHDREPFGALLQTTAAKSF